jgi:hypothetical protein
LCGGTPPKPAYYLGGCGCGAESEPLLLLAALVPLLSLWHRRSPHRRPAR